MDSMRQKADFLGISGSILCIVHCLVTPFLVMAGTFSGAEAIKMGFLSLDYAFILVNIFAVYHATKHHSTLRIRASLWGFLVLFTCAILLEEQHQVFEYLGYAASIGLVVSHIVNLRYCQQCLKHEHPH
jgi:hypothetical protein